MDFTNIGTKCILRDKRKNVLEKMFLGYEYCVLSNRLLNNEISFK